MALVLIGGLALATYRGVPASGGPGVADAGAGDPSARGPGAGGSEGAAWSTASANAEASTGGDSTGTAPSCPEADFIPTDIDALASLRLAALWQTPFLQAGWNALDERARQEDEERRKVIGVSMEDVERITVFWHDPQQPSFAAIVRTTTTFDPDRRKRFLGMFQRPAGARDERKEYRGHEYWLLAQPVGLEGLRVADDPGMMLATHVAGDRLFVVGNEAGVRKALDRHEETRSHGRGKGAIPKGNQMLGWAIPRIADDSHHFLLAGAISDKGRDQVEKLMERVPKEFRELIPSESALITLNLGDDDALAVDCQIRFPSEEKARTAYNALAGPLKLLNVAAPAGAGADAERLARTLGEFFKTLQVAADGRYVRIDRRFDLSPVRAQFARVAHNLFQTRTTTGVPSEAKLQVLAEAMNRYHIANKKYPPAAVTDAKGKPLYSWRVALLPYLGEAGKKLHAEFRLDEPWDSPRNKPLLERMPFEYTHPLAGVDPSLVGLRGHTTFQLPVGPKALFSGNRAPKRDDIADGPETTILLMDCGPPVPWTRPTDVDVSDDPAALKARLLPSDPTKVPYPLPVVLCDGTTRLIPPDVEGQLLLGGIVPNDRMGLGPDPRTARGPVP